MIPERLKPLFFRMENPPIKRLISRLKKKPAKSYPFKNPSLKDLPSAVELHKQIAPKAIKLIKEGIDLHLTAKLQDDRKLEEFVLRAAMRIPVPNKDERKVDWVKYIKGKFHNIMNKELIEIRKICKGAIEGDKITKQTLKVNDQITKQMGKVRKELTKLRDIYLSGLNPPKKPNTIDMLNNLFLQYLPSVPTTFVDKHIRKMVRPFGIELKEGAVKARKIRFKDEWFTWKVNYFIRRED